MDSVKILISLISTFSKVCLGFVFFYLLRVFYVIEDVGIYSVIYSFFSFFVFILDLGFSVAHIKFYSESVHENEKKLCNGTFSFIRTIQFSVYILIVLLLIPFFNLSNLDFSIFLFLFIANLFILMEHYFNPIFYSIKSPTHILIPISFSLIVKIILLFIFITRDLFSLSIILIIGNFIFLVLNFIFLSKFRFSKPNKEYLKKYLKFSFPYFITTSLTIITFYTDTLLLNFWSSLEEVANYATAKLLYLYITMFVVNITYSLLSTFSSNFKSHKTKENIKIIHQLHKLLNLFIIPVFFMILLYSNRIFVFIFGDDYYLTGTILSIISVNFLIISIDCGNTIYIQALGDMKFLAKILILKKLLAITLLLIMISPVFFNLGAIGAAISFVLAEIIIQLVYRPLIFKKYELRLFKGFFRNFVVMFSVFLMQYYINISINYPLIFLPAFIVIDISLYLLIIFILKGFTRDDIKFIKNMLNLKNIKKIVYSELKSLDY